MSPFSVCVCFFRGCVSQANPRLFGVGKRLVVVLFFGNGDGLH